MRPTWFAVAVFAAVVGSIAPLGAGHERQERPERFTTTVFPKGLTFGGAYISGRCAAHVNVDIRSVEVLDCSFSAR